jgi:hypothetical protein
MSDQVERIDPFDGDCESYKITSPINLSQLQAEIVERVDQPIRMVLSVDDIDHVPSEEHPAALLVSPESLDGRTVRGAIDSHKPKVAAAPVPTVSPIVDATPLVAAAIEKLRAGETLTTREISAVLEASLS